MRVALLLEQAYAPAPGGTGRYSRQLAAALAASGRAEVTGWIAWHRDVTPARVPNVLGPRRLPIGRRVLVRTWERGWGPGLPADVVHAPTPLAPPRRRHPLVVTVHDAVPWTHPETLTARGVAWHRAAITAAAAHADALIVPTHATARALAAHVHLRTEPVVVPNAATPMPVPPDAAARRARLGVPSAYIFTLATLEPRKGLDVLIAALALPTAPALPLVVAGDVGWGGLDLSALARTAGLPVGQVVTLGRVPDDRDLAALFDGASVVAMPSRAEGFGIPVLEAMAAGVPVVISDDAALVETGGDAVVSAPIGNAAALADMLTLALHEPAERIARGLARAATFTWERTAEQTAAVYETVC